MIDEYEVDAVIEVILQACRTFNVEAYVVSRRTVNKGFSLTDFIYVADSAAVTKETLKGLKGNKDDEPTITFVRRTYGSIRQKKNLYSYRYFNY